MLEEASVRKMIDDLGGVKKLREEMQEFEDLCDAFHARERELLKQYPDQ